jgi:two-component system sensor histidine kinase DctS
MALRIAEQAERAGKVIKSVHDFVRRRDQAARGRVTASAAGRHHAAGQPAGAQAVRCGCESQVEDDGLPDVLCDRTMVEQVLLNLARNAMQAMDLPACASVAAGVSGARGPASTSDRQPLAGVFGGRCRPGIPAEVARQLFTPFFTTKTEGMGLGLSLCRTVVEQHGGYLDFEPNTPSGTVFRFTLPAVGQPQGQRPSIE